MRLFRRPRTRVIRSVSYSYKRDPLNFFREQCLLYLPWCNEETDIESQDWPKLYEENKEIIQQNRAEFVTISEAEIDELLENIEAFVDDEDDEADEYTQQCLEEQSEDIDILAQAGITKPKSRDTVNRFFAPQKFPLNDILPSLETLNVEQRTIVLHILKCLKTNQVPFYLFLTLEWSCWCW